MPDLSCSKIFCAIRFDDRKARKEQVKNQTKSVAKFWAIILFRNYQVPEKIHRYPSARLLWCVIGAATGIVLALSLFGPPAITFLLVSIGGSTVFLFGLRVPSPAPSSAGTWRCLHWHRLLPCLRRCAMGLRTYTSAGFVLYAAYQGGFIRPLAQTQS